MTIHARHAMLRQRLLCHARRFAWIVSTALITACGGGGGGTVSNADSPTANATLSFAEVTESSSKIYRAAAVRLDYGAKAHLTDVGTVADATGAGVWIMVVDDFQSLHASTTALPPVVRTIKYAVTSGQYVGTYQVDYQLSTPYTHGDLVSSIAGGTKAETSSNVTLSEPTLATANLVSCEHSYGSADCPAAFHATATDRTLKASLTVKPAPGVASQANVEKSHVNLSSTQDPVATLNAIQDHLTNSAMTSAVQVINLSIGAAIQANTNTNVIGIDFPSTMNAVLTVSAGNEAGPCGINDLIGCNAVAYSLFISDQTKDSTIVVGALNAEGKIADYANRAGAMARRYITASGETGFFQNAKGTSFAAPRVAGVAAIIKQKYPTLSSARIADIILLSADKDINQDGLPDFDGFNPIYGHGKLSLVNALALAAYCAAPSADATYCTVPP